MRYVAFMSALVLAYWGGAYMAGKPLLPVF
jgi:hypothetical protein